MTDNDREFLGQSRRLGIIAHAPTRFIEEPESENAIRALASTLPETEKTVLVFDPHFTQAELFGLPCRQVSTVAPEDFDLSAIMADRSMEPLFSFFNRSPLRRLPVVAPNLQAGSHRLLFRRAVMEALRHSAEVNVLEFGCIESIYGGWLTTLGFAESVLDDGVVVSVDANAYSIEIARHYTRGYERSLRFLTRDIFEVAADPCRHLPVGTIGLFFQHIFSDCDIHQERLITLYKSLMPLLGPHASVIVLSGYTPEPIPGSLQEHLIGQGFVPVEQVLETMKPQPRYLVTMTRRP
ncbi:MAG: hypothetical protein Q8S17_04030 [Humidesulfovibrio sp.]|nr:hypothetical protein [Humidesulfovibrio sp.]